MVVVDPNRAFRVKSGLSLNASETASQQSLQSNAADLKPARRQSWLRFREVGRSSLPELCGQGCGDRAVELEQFPGVTIPWLAHLPGTSRGIRVVKVSGTALPILVVSIQIHHALHNLLNAYLNAPALILRRLDRTAFDRSQSPPARRRDACADRKEPAQARPCMSYIFCLLQRGETRLLTSQLM